MTPLLLRRATLVGALALALGALFLLYRASPPRSILSYPGTHDFIEYWTAFRLFSAGSNPYDPALLEPLQRALGWREKTPLMMWNPPWTLVLMAPVLLLPFVPAAVLWLFCNLVLLAGAGSLVAASYGVPRERRGETVCALVVSFATIISLSRGQLGSLLTFGAALLLYALVSGRRGLAGLALLLLTVKPHLFLLLGVVLAWWILSKRAFAIIGAFVAFFVLLAAVTWIAAPESFSQWSTAMSGCTSGNYIRTFQWRTSSLLDPVRALFSHGTAGDRWVLALLPCAVAFLTLSFFALRRGDVRWLDDYPLLLILSLWTSPFAWLFDYSVLSLVQAAIVASGRPRAWLLIALVQIPAFASYATWATSYHHFSWYPGLVLISWLLARRKAS